MPPKHPTSRNTNDIFHKRISDLEDAVKNLVNNKITTVPLHDPLNLPPQGVSGQIAIADPDTALPKTAHAYDEVNGWWQIGSGTAGPWIYVGTPTQVGSTTDIYGTLISDLIAANPAPYNADPWIPFLHFWTNSLGDDAPLSFRIDSGSLVLRGGANGGSDNSVIFNLPVAFRPFYQQPIVAPTGITGDASVDVLANGDVLFIQDN